MKEGTFTWHHREKEVRISKEKLSNQDYFKTWDKFEVQVAEEEASDLSNIRDASTSYNKLYLKHQAQKQQSRSFMHIQQLWKDMNYDSLGRDEKIYLALRE